MHVGATLELYGIERDPNGHQEFGYCTTGRGKLRSSRGHDATASTNRHFLLVANAINCVNNIRQEVFMGQGETRRIQAEAARALAEWKAFFAEHVAMQARQLAKDSNPPGLITVDHYRRAAISAVQSLKTLVQNTGSSDGHQEAA
jgi:hypothetical protein